MSVQVHKLSHHLGYLISCAHCGRTFHATRSDARYCPQPALCRVRSWRSTHERKRFCVRAGLRRGYS